MKERMDRKNPTCAHCMLYKVRLSSELHKMLGEAPSPTGSSSIFLTQHFEEKLNSGQGVTRGHNV